MSSDAKPKVAELRQDANAPNKTIAGTDFGEFNTEILNQLQGSLWTGNIKTQEERIDLVLGAAGAMAGIGPKDAVEAMLAAQMVATHNATMECYRRAMIANQTLEGRNSSLAHANKLTRSFATLSQALDKHRGQGKQTVRVEHVHVYEGGKAMVGSFNQTEMRQAENATPPQIYAPGDENGRD